VNIKISDISNIKQYIYLTPISKMVEFDTEVEWHESHKFLVNILYYIYILINYIIVIVVVTYIFINYYILKTII